MLFDQAVTRKMNTMYKHRKEECFMGHYKIMVETTQNKAAAKTRLNFLTNHNITCYLDTLELDDQTFYSVQAGPFPEKKEALTQVDAIKKLGLRHAFITRNPR
jgi:hypothetical protein